MAQGDKQALLKCQICKKLIYQDNEQQLKCSIHYGCMSCISKYQLSQCPQCQFNHFSQNQLVYTYPIQGVMINYNKQYSMDGQAEFGNQKSCAKKTFGWVMIGILATVFFFSGLAMAISTTQIGFGVIMVIIGVVGVVFAIYFVCKIRKIDSRRAHFLLSTKSFQYQTKNIELQRNVISSVTTNSQN